jgi:hypothetical protein
MWSLRRRGLRPAQIAEELGTSRQFVHQTLATVDARVSSLLLESARANRIEIHSVDVTNGILSGYHRGLGTRTVVSFSDKHGVQVWYWHENPESCVACSRMSECMEYLLDEAEERGVQLTDEERKLAPAKLTRVVFWRLMPEEEP